MGLFPAFKKRPNFLLILYVSKFKWKFYIKNRLFFLFVKCYHQDINQKKKKNKNYKYLYYNVTSLIIKIQFMKCVKCIWLW